MCVVEGCTKKARSKSGTSMCPMHYHRTYRHGSPERSAHSVHTYVRRYRRTSCAGHPLADAYGRAYEHRVALYDAIGAGSHACHWCGAAVTWGADLQVDHLDADGSNNDVRNLVPSCGPCNVTRARQSVSDRLRELGFWSGKDTVAALGGRKEKVGP